MILPTVDRKNKTPLYRQIVSQIVELVDKKTIPSGYIIPSSRVLADRLGVDRSTVFRAYQELWALGYVESRPGSYSTIRKRKEIVSPGTRSIERLIDWESVATPSSSYLSKVMKGISSETNIPGASGKGVINLSPFAMDSSLFPIDEFRHSMDRVLREDGARLLRYGEVQGYEPLREYITQRLRTHGITVTSDEILITNGSQQGIEMLLKLFLTPGAGVITESPTYALALPLLRFYQARIISVPMSDGGIDLDLLETALAKESPALLYTMPTFHNPTGITTTQSHRESLLSLCETRRIPIIEDAFEEEMKYFGKVVLPIKSMDREQIVMYLGTFSKVLFPGIRIGWIAAERELIKRLVAIRRFCELSISPVVQAALSDFCSRGYYDRHVKKMHRICRKKMQAAIRVLREHIDPEKATWHEPAGGYLIWISLRSRNIKSDELEQRLSEHGVIVSPGRFYFPEEAGEVSFRICISSLEEAKITEGIKRIGRALERI